MLTSAARLSLALLLPAMALQQLGWRLGVAPRQESLPLFAVALPWIPVAAVAAVHGFRALRLRELLALAGAGALLLMAVDLLQAFTLGTEAERQVVRDGPGRWALVSIVLWTALLLLFQLAPFAARRGVRWVLRRR